MKKHKTVGEYTPAADGKREIINREYYGQGYIYKNWEAYESGEGVCYIPELSDSTYTKKQFLEICDNQDDLAQELFLHCDWQHPETLKEEWLIDGEWEKCENCGRLYSDFYKGPRPIENCPHCGIRREEE